MVARFPTEMSSIPMFPNAVDTAVRTRPTPAPKSETPTAAPKGDLVSRYQTFMEPSQAELKTAIEDKQKFEFAQEQDVAARTAGKARARGEALDVERTAIEDSAAMRGLSDVDKQMEVPFTPTKDNAMDLATLYSLIGVVGFAIGVGGKGNAQAAMSAMNGMATGYQKGRMDLYAKEKDLFDTNLRQLKTRSETLGRELERITRLAAYDRQKAELEADALFAEQGANFMRDYKAKYGLPKSLELAKQNVEASDKMFQIVIKQEETARNRAEDRAFRLQMAQMQMDARRDIAAMKGGGGRDQKLTKEERSAHRLRQNLIPELEEGIQILDRLNQEGKWNKMTALLGVDTRAAELAFRDDPEALKLIRTFAFFRSKEFETGGKALTRMEDKILAPLYRSDLRVYEAVRNAMNQGVIEMSREKEKLEDQFPSLGGGSDTGGRQSGKTVVRSGKVTSGENAGRTVIEYSDGTREYK
jgi:hypothetical protein